jgi:hypothetical protein
MSKSFITIKATRDALKLLRKIAAETGEKQYEVLERALQKEWDTVQEEKHPIHQPLPLHTYLSENDQQRQETIVPCEGQQVTNSIVENGFSDMKNIKPMSLEVRQRLQGHEQLVHTICMFAIQEAEALGLMLDSINVRRTWSEEYDEKAGLVIDLEIKAMADERLVYWNTLCERITHLEEMLPLEEQRFLNDEICFIVNRS